MMMMIMKFVAFIGMLVHICMILLYHIIAMSDSTMVFLERLHNRTTKGIEEEIGKRVTFSKSIISQLIQFIDKRVTRGKDIAKMLEEVKNVNAKTGGIEKKEKTQSLNDKSVIKEEDKTEDETKGGAEIHKKEADEGTYFDGLCLKRGQPPCFSTFKLFFRLETKGSFI